MFIDAKQRQIEINEDHSGINIEAHHDGLKIGSIEFEEIEDMYGRAHISLFGRSVDIKYQRSGIGVEMMRLAAKIHGRSFRKPSFLAVGGSRVASDTYYTQDGAALILKCIKLGIIEDTDRQEIYDY